MASKRISEKTAKIVWARAGGVCSYPDCLKSLIVSPENASDPLAVLGEIAHIVGHSEYGPVAKNNFEVQIGIAQRTCCYCVPNIIRLLINSLRAIRPSGSIG